MYKHPINALAERTNKCVIEIVNAIERLDDKNVSDSAALMMVLMDRGLLTPEQWEEYRAKGKEHYQKIKEAKKAEQ